MNLFGKADNWRQIYQQTSSTLYTSDNVCCLQNIWLRRENYLDAMTRRFNKNLLRFTPLRVPTE